VRSLKLALALLAVPILVSPLLLADDAPPNFSGTWQLDGGKSPAAAGQAVTLTIQDSSGKITFTRVAHAKDGKEITFHFSCKTGGNQCDFDEGGYKAKVSLWYNGPALVILKTDGPKEDSVTQWKLQLSPDKHTLNVEFTPIEPNEKSEDLVFDKQS
jgi:hypothetical protein